MKLMMKKNSTLFFFFFFSFLWTFSHSILCQLLLVGGRVDEALKVLDNFCSKSLTEIPIRYTFLLSFSSYSQDAGN